MRAFNYSLQEGISFFRSQLHDLTTEINYPDHLLLLVQNVFAQKEESLHGVGVQYIIINIFADFIVFDDSNPVKNNNTRCIIATQNTMRIDLFKFLYFSI